MKRFEKKDLGILVATLLLLVSRVIRYKILHIRDKHKIVSDGTGLHSVPNSSVSDYLRYSRSGARDLQYVMLPRTGRDDSAAELTADQKANLRVAVDRAIANTSASAIRADVRANLFSKLFIRVFVDTLYSYLAWSCERIANIKAHGRLSTYMSFVQGVNNSIWGHERMGVDRINLSLNIADPHTLSIFERAVEEGARYSYLGPRINTLITERSWPSIREVLKDFMNEQALLDVDNTVREIGNVPMKSMPERLGLQTRGTSASFPLFDDMSTSYHASNVNEPTSAEGLGRVVQSFKVVNGVEVIVILGIGSVCGIHIYLRVPNTVKEIFFVGNYASIIQDMLERIQTLEKWLTHVVTAQHGVASTT